GPPSGNPIGGRSGTRGGSLRIANAKTLVKGCGFVGNRVISHGDGSPVYVGGTVAVSDSSGGSVFQNCAFVGNEAYGGTGNGASAGVLVYLNSDTATCAFTNCTFAYNGSYMGNGGALCVYRGKTYVRNSIFHGDVVAATQTFINWGGPYTGHELYVSKAVSTSPGTGIEVDYSILPSLESPYVVDGADLGRVLLGGNVGTADPLLMTNACAITISSQIPSFAIKPVGINFHLQGKGGYLDEITGERVTRLAGGARAGDSPAIAAGDPLSDCSKQPSGKRVNLGFYGNTPWASVAVGQQFLLIIR
ncbi:MAG: hypothetical protein GX590_12635, partial [Lentisphaerae bacterium]|nr:hypothetical protein [Lentisphaerota bacterium]